MQPWPWPWRPRRPPWPPRAAARPVQAEARRPLPQRRGLRQRPAGGRGGPQAPGRLPGQALGSGPRGLPGHAGRGLVQARVGARGAGALQGLLGLDGQQRGVDVANLVEKLVPQGPEESLLLAPRDQARHPVLASSPGPTAEGPGAQEDTAAPGVLHRGREQRRTMGLPLLGRLLVLEQGRHQLEPPGPFQQAPVHLRGIVPFEQFSPPGWPADEGRGCLPGCPKAAPARKTDS